MMLQEEAEEIVGANTAGERYEWNVDTMVTDVRTIFPLDDTVAAKLAQHIGNEARDDREVIATLVEEVVGAGKVAYGIREKHNGEEAQRAIERSVVLRSVDQHWMDHLDAIEHLRQGIGLRGYGQQDPLIEYKKEAFDMFSQLLANIRTTTLRTIFRAAVVAQEDSAMMQLARNMQLSGAGDDAGRLAAMADREQQDTLARIPKIQQPLRADATIGRNDPCPCGSGKKYKKCHGK